MLVMALSPPIAAITGWILMNETLSGRSLAGMILTISGISLAILGRPVHNDTNPDLKKKRFRFKLKYSIKGRLFAFGGAAGPGIGLVLSRQIARNHGGDLQLSNRALAAGAQSRLLLPLMPEC